jgi:hypothetical protein
MRQCDYCGEPIQILWQGSQRFCCHEHSDAWFQEERRQAVEWFRQCGMIVQTPAREDAA